MSLVSPHNARNAIKNVAYAFEFSQQLSSDTVKHAIEIYKQSMMMSVELPRSQPIESMTFQMEGTGAFSPSSKMLAGVSFDRLLANGEPEWSVTFRPDAFVIICGRYESWSKNLDKAFEYMQIFSKALKDVSINTIGLEFNDEFNISNLTDPSWMEELFNVKSNYLTQDILNKKGAWHLHSGYWSEDYYHKDISLTLINSFIESLEDQQTGKCHLKIKHLQKCRYFEPIDISTSSALESAKVIFEKAHEVNYNFMCDLIGAAMKIRINMEDK